MIIGIGIDLISNQRIKIALNKFKDNFKNKIYTKNELQDFNQKFSKKVSYSLSQINFLAKRFASKEAFSKALGTGIGRGINFNDIEIFNDDLGRPNIRIINDKNKILEKIIGTKNYNIHLTISDEKSISIAMVIIEKL
jgi:holo-[acyl-carrier protein] synthase